MIPSDWYRTRRDHWRSRGADLSRRALTLSRARVATFLTAAALLGWGIAHRNLPAGIIGLAGFVAFGWLAAIHARVLAALERCEAAGRHHSAALARLTRDWAHVPEAHAPGSVDLNAHPYAVDLDLAGRASLAAWLGAPATSDGERHLWRWLLSSSDPADVAKRQDAVEDLAAKREWRESLAVEGALLNVSAADMASFLAWAESAVPALPRAVGVLSGVLTVALWVLLAVFLPPVISTYPFPAQPGQDPDALMRLWFQAWPTPWWLIPFVLGVVLSYLYERQICAVFDRAGLGERSLPGLSTMLALVCREPWRAPNLAAAQARMQAGGDAPSIVRTLARRSGWSELRRSAALLHFPIQAFTLWDFHVLFLVERWRAHHGTKVRGWLDSLGEVDALAVLSHVRADEPGWAMPTLDPSAESFEAAALGHPLINGDRRVANDVTVGPKGSILLVTGSNMSGKSTLLRSVGLNAVLAQAGAPVCAASLRMPPADIYTSIRIQDSLAQGFSYFMASLARLKAIVDAADRAGGGRVLLYLLDELLQGTNSAERGIAVRAVVRHLLAANTIGMMTTHDLALASQPPLSTAARLVHFTEQVKPDGTMTFDYTLRSGLATSTNALRLMQLIGIDPE
jgi:hypothetical protein